jgi:thioredoxin 1
MIITFIVVAAIVIILFLFVAFLRKKLKSIENIPESKKIKTLTDQNFKNQIKNGAVLVDFWASWCVPCKMMAPILNEVAEEAETGVVIGKVNVDEATATASLYGIRSIPTLILFNNGKEIHRITGVKSKDQIVKELKKRLN